MRDAGNRIGLVVNPLAGLGGPAGLKGSDDPATAARARAMGLAAQAPSRAAIALAELPPETRILTGPGALGAEAAALAGHDCEPLEIAPTGTAEDSRALARRMADRVALLLFAGGDGTARDIAGALGPGGPPILGIPAGVKMQSAVFARTPRRAGQIAGAFLASETRRTQAAEIMDIDEGARTEGRISARLYGSHAVPALAGASQGPKAGGDRGLAEIDAAIARYVAAMDPEMPHVIGPGTTMQALKDRLGGGTLMGVDLALGGCTIARDLSEPQLLRLLPEGRAARIVLGVVGGQGFLLGRGNQPISAALIRRIGPQNIDVICQQAKLAALNPAELAVDTGDPALDARLRGYAQVLTGPGRRQVVRLSD